MHNPTTNRKERIKYFFQSADGRCRTEVDDFESMKDLYKDWDCYIEGELTFTPVRKLSND